MTERKFTDEEITKALEYIADTEDYKLINYPDVRAHSAVKVINLAINLINRLQAENERLKIDVPRFYAINEVDPSLADLLRNSKPTICLLTDDSSIEIIPNKETIRTEAIKDFAERLKKANPNRFAGSDHFHEVYWDDDFDEEIDNLVKEMIGAQE